MKGTKTKTKTQTHSTEEMIAPNFVFIQKPLATWRFIPEALMLGT